MTGEQRAGLARLMLRWPDRKMQLRLASGGRFREVCESYELASVAFAHWARQTEPEAVAIAEEYRRIILELEQEIAATWLP